ncbi:hypothetical protein [Devosia sp.]|uniref:hypothetical protein n=1 Tax=Devosia sp. TaxID=1871048 RepID=UPI001AC750CD|nr:hypothetical protein [Devosia sp.]MBN9309602.1 hypothetical protein [Devosia sp.]
MTSRPFDLLGYLPDDAEPRQRVRLERTWLGLAAATFAVVAYLDFDNLLVSVSVVGALAKIAYIALVAGAFGILTLQRGQFRRGLPEAWVLLGFMIAAAAGYVTQMAAGRAPNSYLAAFMPPVLYSLSLVLPLPRKPVDGNGLVRALTVLLMVLGALYALEVTVRSASGNLGRIDNLENHVKSVSLVLAAGLAMASGRWRLLAVIVALSTWTTLQRPSSTFILALSVCLSVAWLIKIGQSRLAECVCYALLAVLALSPFVVSFVPGASEMVLGVEGMLKQDLLGGETNTAVRLVIQGVAMNGMQGFDWVYGQLFTGATSVYVADMLPWWWDNSDLGLATIHSDYVILLGQSGLIGYVAYSACLAALCRRGFRANANEGVDDVAVRAVFPICVVALGIYSAANPFLQYYQISHVVWLCLGLAQYALLAIGARHHSSVVENVCPESERGSSQS